MEHEALEIIEVPPVKKRIYFYPGFAQSDQFVAPWWGRQQACEAYEHWISVTRAGVEVARAKFVLHEGPQDHPLLGSLTHGYLDILVLEVALSERGNGVGRAVLDAIARRYPLVRLTALNDGDGSRGFWDRVGWTRHEHPEPLMRSPRVTYSCPVSTRR